MEQSSIVFPDAVKGYKCPCCGSFIKQYVRKFNSNMATALLALYKHNVNGYVKLEEFLSEHGYKRCGDASYLVHYRMLEKLKAKREDGSKKNGYYKLTSVGIMFIEGKTTAKEKFIIQQNRLVGFDGEDVGIKDILGVKFNFDEMMKTVA